MSQKIIFNVKSSLTYNHDVKEQIEQIKQTALDGKFGILTGNEYNDNYKRITSYPQNPVTYTSFYMDSDPKHLLCVITAPEIEEKEGQYSITVYYDEEAASFLSKQS
jgi:hypothetical protein